LNKAESRKQKAESRKQKAESRKQKAESRKQKAESRKQKAERRAKPKITIGAFAAAEENKITKRTIHPSPACGRGAGGEGCAYGSENFEVSPVKVPRIRILKLANHQPKFPVVNFRKSRRCALIIQR
jgi:hypothetical protein